jgi:hypothetical protein
MGHPEPPISPIEAGAATTGKTFLTEQHGPSTEAGVLMRP